jgi:hypothetical protein
MTATFYPLSFPRYNNKEILILNNKFSFIYEYFLSKKIQIFYLRKWLFFYLLIIYYI